MTRILSRRKVCPACHGWKYVEASHPTIGKITVMCSHCKGKGVK